MKAKIIFNLDKLDEVEKFKIFCKASEMFLAIDHFKNLLFKYNKHGIPGHIKTPQQLLDEISKDFHYYTKGIKP